MDAFTFHRRTLSDYQVYLRGFLSIVGATSVLPGDAPKGQLAVQGGNVHVTSQPGQACAPTRAVIPPEGSA